MIDSGFLGILILALTAGSVNATDWMTMVQPTEYFQSRNMEPSIDRMIDFVIEDVDSPKSHIRHLTALRHLANHSNKFKRAENYHTNRMAIEEVAAGKRAQDSTGFVQEYAQRLLDKLDGTKPAATKFRPLRQDALDWFPAGIKMALAFDMHQLQDLSNDTRKGILTTLAEDSKLSLYEQLETMGNLRVDRLAFGITDTEKPEDQKVFVHVSGKANQAWIADSLIAKSGNTLQATKSKAADGTPVIMLHGKNAGACVVLIGHTDMIFVTGQNVDGERERTELLAIRAKKKPHAASGNLKDRLAKIPEKAIGFLVGDLPGEFKEEVRGFLDPLPAKFCVHVERDPMGLGLLVKGETVMKDAAEANNFVAKVLALRKEGIAGLQKALKEPPEPGLPGMPLMPLQTILIAIESVQVGNQAANVHVSGSISNQLIQQLGERYVYKNRRAAEPPGKDGK